MISCCNEEIFPFLSPMQLVRMEQVSKLLGIRITTYFRVHQIRLQSYRIDPPLDDSLESVYLPSR